MASSHPRCTPRLHYLGTVGEEPGTPQRKQHEIRSWCTERVVAARWPNRVRKCDSRMAVQYKENDNPYFTCSVARSQFGDRIVRALERQNWNPWSFDKC